jgi:riboflavin biosynthesis pyrimidine reductase
VSAARPCTAGISGPSRASVNRQVISEMLDGMAQRPWAATCSGGASCARHAIAAGIVDEIDLQVDPVILGAGERLLDGLEAEEPALELVRVLEAPGVTHLCCRVVR